MNFDELLKEAMTAAGEGRLSQKSDAELNELLLAVRSTVASNPYAKAWVPTLDALREEIELRERKKYQAETKEQHEAAIEESKKLHLSVQKLHKPHWSLTPSFGVLVVTMIFAGIAAWPVINDWISKLGKNQAGLPLQTNSASAIIVTPKTSPPPAIILPSTNKPSK